MRFRPKHRTTAIALAVSLAMAVALMLAPGLASAQGASDDLAGAQVSETPEWAIDDGQDAREGELGAQAVAPMRMIYAMTIWSRP